MSNPCSAKPPPTNPNYGDPPQPGDEGYEDYLKWQATIQKCHELEGDQLTEEDVKSRVPEILANLGIGECRSFTGGGFSLASLGWSVGAGSVGCEQIQVLASTLLMQTRVQMCTLNTIVQEKDEQTSIKSNIDVAVLEGSKYDCKGGIRFANKVRIKKIDKTAFSSAMSSAMSAEILQTIVESFQQQQSQETGFLATSAGQKLISDVLTAINTDIMLQTINCSIQRIFDKIDVESNIRLTLGPRAVMQTDEDCTMENDTEIGRTSESIVLSSMQSVMDVQAVIDYFKEMSVFQDNKAKGFGLGFGLIILGILALGALFILGFFKYGSQVMDKKGTVVLIVCLTLLAIGATILGFYLKIRKEKADYDKNNPPCPAEGPCVPCEEGKRCNNDDDKDPDDGKPPGPCRTITLTKNPTKGWSSFLVLNTIDAKGNPLNVRETIAFEDWDESVSSITLCVKDFVTVWNSDKASRQRRYLGTLFLDQDNKLILNDLKVDAWPAAATVRFTGEVDWWRRMGFNTEGPAYPQRRPIKAPKHPWP